MYITINNITGKKRIDLSYPNSSGGKAPEGPRSMKIMVVIMLSDNVQYLLKESMAKVKLTHIVGPTMCADKS